MSLQYIIDGYNIIHHHLFIPHTTKKIKDPRLKLLEFIKINKPCGSLKNKITVVFDGFPISSESEHADTNINVIFSRKISADDKIKRIVEEYANRKNIVVVSDDNEIKFFVKSLGAKVMNVQEFISSKEKLPQHKQDILKSELTYSQMHKINEELKKIWLR